MLYKIGEYVVIKAVIFDLDGVLVHTDALHFAAWKKLCDELAIPFDERLNGLLRGVSRMASFEIILQSAGKSFSDKRKEQLAERKNESYRALIAKMSPSDVSDDTMRALTLLRERGIGLAVGSSSKNTAEILDRTGLKGFFQAVADGNMIARSKPDPEVFLLAAELLKVSPDEAIVVEDAISGLQAAKAGGFLAAAVGDEALESPLADYKLRSLCDLENFI